MVCSDEINTWLMTASPLSEEERETFAKVMERVSLSGYGRADMPGNTIITEPLLLRYRRALHHAGPRGRGGRTVGPVAGATGFCP